MKNSRKLKIGLDYHGVIDNNINYFSVFCRKAKRRGHDIYVITGGPKVSVSQKLNAINMPYDMCFAISDYYIALHKIEQNSKGKVVIPDNLWNMAKADFCRRSKINIHIDDSVKYINWFSTPYCYYNKNTNKGYISPGIEFDFNQSADIVLDKIEKMISKLTCFV